MQPHHLLLALSLVAALTGCGGPNDDTDETGDTDETADTDDTDASGPPAITISSPSDSNAYGSITLTYQVTDFTIDADALANDDLEPVDGAGHIHIKLDGEYKASTSELTYRLDGVPSGTHTVSVVLAGNDHTESSVSDSITLNVLNPTVEILTPADGTVLDASSATLGLSIGDFTMSSHIGGAPVFGEGHYHVIIAGETFDFIDPTRALATQLGAGSHSLAIELVSSDHSPLVPPVLDTLTFDVAADAPGVWIDKTALEPEELNTATLTIPVSVTNFTLVPFRLEAPNVPGEGHYRVYLDGVYQTFSADDTVTLHHVTPGTHIVEVRLAENDDTEVVGGSIDYVRVDVAESRPDVFITSPSPDEIVMSTFSVSVMPENFIFDEKNIDGANVPGTGHYFIWVDGEYHTFSAEPSTLVFGLEQGPHVISATLVNNDHTHLAEAVWSEEIRVVVDD